MWQGQNNKFIYTTPLNRVLAETTQLGGLWSAVVHYHRDCKTNLGEFLDVDSAKQALEMKLKQDGLLTH